MKERISFGAIAASLGVSRSAVIGKLGRSGIRKPRWDADVRKSPKAAPSGMSDPEKDEKGASKALPPDRKILSIIAATHDCVHPPVPAGARRGVADLDDAQCRWPIGDPRSPEFHFCAKSRALGMSYCDGHARLAYLPDVVIRTNPPLQILPGADGVGVFEEVD